MSEITGGIIQIEFKENESLYKKIGTGFFINKDGDFITAKHVIDSDFLKCYRCLNKGQYFEIKKKSNINNKAIIRGDVALFSIELIDEKSFTPEFYEISDYSTDNELLGAEVQIVGYFNEKILITQTIISNIQNDIITLQSGNLGKGISGSPVFLKRNSSVIGVISQKKELKIDFQSQKFNSDGFNLAFACTLKSIDCVVKKPLILLNNSSGKYDEHFKKELKLIQENYQQQSNYLPSIKQISNLVDHIEENRTPQNSFLLAKTLQFGGFVLLNANLDSDYATEYLSKSREIFETLKLDSKSEIIRTGWLYSISHKINGNPIKAYEICSEINNSLDNKIPYHQISPLLREIAVISKEKDSFNYIKKNIINLSSIEEMFHTYRRLFEFYLFQELYDDADKIFINHLNPIYLRIEQTLYKIYKVAYFKNLFHYYYIKNDIRKSKKYYNIVLEESTKFGFYGQMKGLFQIKSLLDVTF